MYIPNEAWLCGLPLPLPAEWNVDMAKEGAAISDMRQKQYDVWQNQKLEEYLFILLDEKNKLLSFLRP